MAKPFLYLPLLVSLKWLTIYPLGLNKRAPMTPKIMAADIPALVTSNIPVMTPIKPCSSASAIAPCTNEFPKLVIGTVAPAPAKSMSGSYRPNPSKTAPARSEEHTSELQSRGHIVCRLLLETKKQHRL